MPGWDSGVLPWASATCLGWRNLRWLCQCVPAGLTTLSSGLAGRTKGPAGCPSGCPAGTGGRGDWDWDWDWVTGRGGGAAAAAAGAASSAAAASGSRAKSAKEFLAAAWAFLLAGRSGGVMKEAREEEVAPFFGAAVVAAGVAPEEALVPLPPPSRVTLSLLADFLSPPPHLLHRPPS